MHALRDGARRALVEDLSRRVGEMPADRRAFLSADEIRGFVERGVEVARNHGIRSLDLLERYLALMVRVGGQLDETPWAAPILADAFLNPADKLFELERSARAMADRAAKRSTGGAP